MNIQASFTSHTPTAPKLLPTSDGIHFSFNKPEHIPQTSLRHDGSGFIAAIKADFRNSISCSRMSLIHDPIETVISTGANHALKEKNRLCSAALATLK